MSSENIFIRQEENDISSDNESRENRANVSLFDITIGHIEDILVDEDFLKLQRDFLEKYWKDFDETDENRLCYTAIFEEYVTKIETFFERTLKAKIPQFNMDEFYDQLLNKRDTLDGEVFETLYTLSDFLAFKEMVLDYKNMKEGKTADFSTCISVKPIAIEEDIKN